MKVTSPLTGKTDVTLLETIPAAEIVRRWEREFGFDVTDELKERDAVFLYRCDRTGLRFFVPSEAAGSPSLYERLESLDWYYLPEKWEHDEALRDLAGCRRILEVGCGRGAFVERLLGLPGVEARGIEINRRAVAEARARNLPVEGTDVETLSRDEPAGYDAVCAFQVLEHVPAPGNFLTALLRLLRPKGRLILSVPNANSFIRHARDGVLDGPPHHMTRWDREVFERLATLLLLRVRRVAFEPLADYHVDWYVDVLASRIPPDGPLGAWGRAAPRRILRPLLRKSKVLRGMITGHTLYLCCEKTVPGNPQWGMTP